MEFVAFYFIFFLFFSFYSAIKTHLHIIHLDWMYVNTWTLFRWYKYLRFSCMFWPNVAPSTEHLALNIWISENDCLATSIDTISMHLLFLSKAIALNSFVYMFCYHLLLWLQLQFKFYRHYENCELWMRYSFYQLIDTYPCC